MKCPKCKKDYEEGVEAAYKLGLIDGERVAQKTVALLSTTNRAMLDEFNRLDYLIPNPNHPDTVTVPIKIVAGLIKSKDQRKEKSRVSHRWFMIKLQQVTKAQCGNLHKYL